MDEFWAHRVDIQPDQPGRRPTRSPPWRHDDHRFVYMGSPGTWTPFHTDVLNLRQFVQLEHQPVWDKEVVLYPPSEAFRWVSKLATCLDLRTALALKEDFPQLADYKPIIVYQFPGETVFVPSGWGHQVINLSNTISINQNWSNGYNMKAILRCLNASLKEVQAAIADCKVTMLGSFEFESHSQVLLKCHAGINHLIWYQWFYSRVAQQLGDLAEWLPKSPIPQPTVARLLHGIHAFPPLNCPDPIRVLAPESFLPTGSDAFPKYFRDQPSNHRAWGHSFSNLRNLAESLAIMISPSELGVDQGSVAYLSQTLGGHSFPTVLVSLNALVGTLEAFFTPHPRIAWTVRRVDFGSLVALAFLEW
ncbi:hypothetical protein L0F63_005403 [Massospora cicadina]|nr:hypothetical protein L0F63_005403 [Massospora cicadina]